jgi:hypothetical protein
MTNRSTMSCYDDELLDDELLDDELPRRVDHRQDRTTRSRNERHQRRRSRFDGASVALDDLVRDVLWVLVDCFLVRICLTTFCAASVAR